MIQSPENMNMLRPIIYDVEDLVAYITINRPEKHNAINLSMLHELRAAVERADADDNVKVMVIRGSGHKSFSAGIDLSGGILDDSEQITATMLATLLPLLECMEKSRKLIIASVEGAAIGLGCSLALQCDLLAMSENASLDLAFLKLGLIADGGLNWQLPHRLGYSRALQLVLEAQVLDAHRCLALGLANKVLSAEHMPGKVSQWAVDLANGPSAAQAYTKQLMRAAMNGRNLLDTVRMEAEVQAACAKTGFFQKVFAGYLER